MNVHDFGEQGSEWLKVKSEMLLRPEYGGRDRDRSWDMTLIVVESYLMVYGRSVIRLDLHFCF